MKFLAAILATVLFTAAAPMSVAQTAQAPATTVTGKWHFVFQTDDGERVFDPMFQQDGSKVTGKWGAGDVKGTFADGKLNLEFPYNSDEEGPGTLKINAQLANDELSGDWAFQDYSGKCKATRVQEPTHGSAP